MRRVYIYADFYSENNSMRIIENRKFDNEVEAIRFADDLNSIFNEMRVSILKDPTRTVNFYIGDKSFVINFSKIVMWNFRVVNEQAGPISNR